VSLRWLLGYADMYVYLHFDSNMYYCHWSNQKDRELWTLSWYD